MFTLHVEHAILLGVFTILTLINCRLYNGARWTYWFPAYTLCAFLGAVLIALRGHGITDATSILYGMTLFHAAYLCLHFGLEGFFERREMLNWPVAVQILSIFVAIGGLFEYGVVHPDTGRRLIWYSLIFALQTALIAVVAWRNARGQVTVPARMMSVLLALLTINNLVRVVVTLLGGAPANYMQGGLGLQLSLVETSVLQCGIVVAFVWMTAARLHERLDLLASTDPLTGLLNRRALEASAERILTRSRSSREPLTAVLIDLDRFKRINDTYGHTFGDRVLLEISGCLQRHMRQSDLLARVGGDEFAVMLENTSVQEALDIAERLRRSLEELVVATDEAEVRVSASFGLAEADEATASWTELVTRCDKAVYAGKEIGGNLAVAS